MRRLHVGKALVASAVTLTAFAASAQASLNSELIQAAQR